MNLEALTVVELLKRHSAVMDELRRRDIVRSANSPISDLAEVLCCRAFNWTREGNSVSGHDAVDGLGRRYQIKARQIGTSRSTRQLSAIRNLDQDPFDVLAGILFDRDFTVHRAALVPIAVVKQRSTWSKHTNSRIFYLVEDVWAERGVVDVSAELRAVAAEL
jgi:hypothetical protein